MKFKRVELGPNANKRMEIKHAAGIASNCQCAKCLAGNKSTRAKRREEERKLKKLKETK